MEKMPNFDLERKNIQKTNQNPVLRIRIRMIRKVLASWIRIRKNIRIHEAKYQPKLQQKKNYSQNPNLNY